MRPKKFSGVYELKEIKICISDIFRPYGDVVSARVYRPFLTLPPEITRWVPSIELQGAYCAVIEYPTARCAKFAVGVLRERVTTNKYRFVSHFKPFFCISGQFLALVF